MSLPEHARPITCAVKEERLALIESRVTLNGRPARILGACNRFATVAQIPTGEAHEWSWEAVKLIVAEGGKFRS